MAHHRPTSMVQESGVDQGKQLPKTNPALNPERKIVTLQQSEKNAHED